MKKKDLPVADVRRYLEPGPVVLVSSAHKGARTIMTMGWHMCLSEDGLVGAFVWDRNYSHELIRKSKECVINVPTVAMAETVARIGNHSGRDIDKFDELGLTAVKGERVKAPLIGECFANFECELVSRRDIFVFQVVKAHVALRPKYPETLHYRGDGRFMLSGPTVSTWRRLFPPAWLHGRG